MLSPHFNDLTGNEQLNFVKTRLNKVVSENAKKSYEMKQQMEGINDITDIERQEKMTPGFIEKNIDVHKQVLLMEDLINKISLNMLNIIPLFAVGPLGGNQGNGLRIIQPTDVGFVNSNFEKIEMLLPEASKNIESLLEKLQYFGKSDEKIIQKLSKMTDTLTTKMKTKFLNANNVSQIVKISGVSLAARDDITKLMNDYVVNIYNKLIVIEDQFQTIEEKLYENNINPVLQGKGMLGGSAWYPKLYPDIPSKYQ